jgi:hypothetical protein
MPVIPVNRVVDKKRTIIKMGAKEERHKRSLTPPPPKKRLTVTYSYLTN